MKKFLIKHRSEIAYAVALMICIFFFAHFVSLGRDYSSTVQAQAAERAEKEMNEWIDASGARNDVVQMRALEAPIKLLRGMARWQVFLKMYFKGDLPGATRRMQALADEAESGVRAELEVNPSNLF